MPSLVKACCLLAMIPAMVGPLPLAARSIVVPLCSGGVTTIPLDPPAAPGTGTTPCCAKGCHTGSSRKRLDRAQ